MSRYFPEALVQPGKIEYIPGLLLSPCLLFKHLLVNRQILITVLLSVFIALLGIGVIIPVLPVFATELGAGGMGLGMVIAVFSISRSLVMPLVGGWSDRLGRRRFLITGLFVYGVVGVLIPSAGTVSHLLVIRTLHGVGSAMIVPVAMAYMASLARPGMEGRYMSWLNIAMFCGVGCGPVLGGIVMDIWGLASVFHIMAGLCFIACILVLRNMPKQPPEKTVPERTLLKSIGAMLRRRQTLGLLITRCSTMFMLVPTMAFLPLLMNNWQCSGLDVGLVMACRTLANAVLQVPFGRLADTKDKVQLLTVGTIFMGVAVMAVPLANGFATVMLIYLLLGAGEAVIWPVLGAMAAEEGREHFGYGTIMGVFNLAISGGVFLGAVLGGMVMEMSGLAWVFRVAGIAVIAVTLFGVLLIQSGSGNSSRSFG
ncbi:MAG: MFS transporter [Deltaproteobacteria bacterium]|nr:MAG: MFS transporter [Deltaproteobacteria bacterium]